MALQIRAAERFNHRVYYGFYGVHSEWTSEHEQGRRKRTGTYALCISLFPVSAASQVNNSERYFKFLAIINQKKKKRQTLQSHVLNPFIHKLQWTQTTVRVTVPLSPAVTWLSVRYLGCRLGAAGRFRCCNQTPLIPPRLITRLKFCTNWLASHTTARGPRLPGNPWRQMSAEHFYYFQFVRNFKLVFRGLTKACFNYGSRK